MQQGFWYGYLVSLWKGNFFDIILIVEFCSRVWNLFIIIWKSSKYLFKTFILIKFKKYI